jgi:hypothetical protein
MNFKGLNDGAPRTRARAFALRFFELNDYFDWRVELESCPPGGKIIQKDELTCVILHRNPYFFSTPSIKERTRVQLAEWPFHL